MSDTPSRKSLESRLLESFIQYATEDVAYNDPGTPPLAMTFAALGHFFADSCALGDITSKSQQRFIERIAPPLGRHITWTDFKIILELVAEKRFPDLHQDLAIRQTLEDILLNLQLGPAAGTRRGNSPLGSSSVVRQDNLYQDVLPSPPHDGNVGDDNDDEQHDKGTGKEESPKWKRDRNPYEQSTVPATRKSAADGLVGKSSRSASKATIAASDATTNTVGGKKTKAAAAASATRFGYMPRAIYSVTDPVLAYLGAGHSGEELCRRLQLPTAAAAAFDGMTSPLFNDWTPAQRLWGAIVQASSVVFPTSNKIAAEELTFQLLHDRLPMLPVP